MGRVDAIVVGAGLVGSAAAWHLAASGASVLLVDRADPNGGASGQNAGSLHFQIERRFLENGDDPTAARVLSLNRLAIKEWAGLGTALDADIGLRQNGGLMVAETADEVELLNRKVRCEQDAGLGTMMVDGDAAREMAPCLSPTIRAAGFMAMEGHADPKKVGPTFLRMAAAHGACVRLHRRVVAISRERGFMVTLAEGDATVASEQWTADRILVAAGAWSPAVGAMANIHLPLFPVALTMNVTERIGPMLHLLVQHIGRRLSVKQAIAGNILIGGGWPARLQRGADGSFDPGLTAEPIERARLNNLAAAVATIPRISDVNLIRSWTGVTAVSADQLPLVGEVPRMPGFFVAAGGSAFTLGPVFARLVATQMLGRDRADADEALAIVSPARFDHLNSFMG